LEGPLIPLSRTAKYPLKRSNSSLGITDLAKERRSYGRFRPCGFTKMQSLIICCRFAKFGCQSKIGSLLKTKSDCTSHQF
jgi:hypothetical protein